MKSWLSLLLACACGTALAQTEAPQFLRGSVESFDGRTLVFKERSGETVRLALAPDFSVSEVLPTPLSAIAPGSYIGSAARPGPDGTLTALEVHVFPEPMRGVGEGHRPWDLLPGSTMTNATVQQVVGSPQGRSVQLRYKGGEQTLVVPEGVPVVTFKPGDRSLLVPGAKGFVTAQLQGGQPTALRASVGRDGFAPPM
jgi:hypothetical protein